jgi:hypothetical protein
MIYATQEIKETDEGGTSIKIRERSRRDDPTTRCTETVATMAPVLRIRLAAAKRIHRSELTLFFGEEVEGGRGRGGATMEVGGEEQQLFHLLFTFA